MEKLTQSTMNLITEKYTTKDCAIRPGRIPVLISENFVYPPPGKMDIIARHRL